MAGVLDSARFRLLASDQWFHMKRRNGSSFWAATATPWSRLTRYSPFAAPLCLTGENGLDHTGQTGNDVQRPVMRADDCWPAKTGSGLSMRPAYFGKCEMAGPI